MLLDIIRQFNWVDILVLILLARIGCVALRTTLFTEFFKALGTLAAIYIALHYFTALSDFIGERIFLENIPLEFLDFFSCFILGIAGYLVFVVLREAIGRLIKIEPIRQLDRWGGLVLGLARVFLLSSLIIFMLAISSVSYLRKSVAVSYSGRYLFKVPPSLYINLWNGLFSKFMRAEKFNQDIPDIQENFSKE